ncbi:MAG: FAD-binding oxidoreductase [Catenulispora sp.]
MRRTLAQSLHLEGEVLTPKSPRYDDARRIFATHIDRRPAVIARVATVDDVARVIAHARDTGSELAIRGGGHSPAGHGMSDGIVIDLSALRSFELDLARRTAWAGAGLTAGAFTAAAGDAGLATGFGDTGSVGIGGITLAGGIGFLVRKHGLTIDNLLAAEIVTADGRLRHVDAQTEPELFWALRGVKGNFGVVIALEFDVFPLSRLYAGSIYFPGERTADVLRAWTAWHPSTPETMVTSIAVMRMRAIPDVPEPLRGKFLVSVRIAYNGTTADGQRMVGPLRAVAPAVLDTVRDMPYTEVASIHNEPTDPVPYYERGIMLRELPAQAQDKLIELVGPDAETTLVMAELRALGGAWDREPAVPDAVATRGLPYSLLGVSAGPLSQEQQLKRSVAELLDGMKPWQSDRRYVNNLAPDEAADAAAIYGPERYERLSSIKRTYDPANMFRLNHNVMPADD